MRLPKGFMASGINCGVRKGRPDLALFYAPGGASAAAVFTTNRFQAAPVVISRSSLVKSGGRIRAVLVNSGSANAMTGSAGMASARRIRGRLSRMLECDQNEVFLASTGTIGLPLQEALISGALPEAVKGLSPDGVDAASRAILTTDIGPKVALKTFKWHGRTGMVTGVAKGAGMIHPDMATMLVFIMTDAPAGPEFLKSALKAAVDKSFHSISVDGDTSTNDTVLLMASGRLAGPEMKSVSEASGFMKALTDVCRSLAWMVVRDGEGAERVMEISVKGARSDREASRAAHAVATSPLVKTALHGGDPNWGRILAAVGRSGARFSAGRVSLKVGDLVLVENGEPAIYREEKAARIFSRERVPVSIDLGAGSCKAFLMTCDLGHDYVTLNADYRT